MIIMTNRLGGTDSGKQVDRAKEPDTLYMYI